MQPRTKTPVKSRRLGFFGGNILQEDSTRYVRGPLENKQLRHTIVRGS